MKTRSAVLAGFVHDDTTARTQQRPTLPAGRKAVKTSPPWTGLAALDAAGLILLVTSTALKLAVPGWWWSTLLTTGACAAFLVAGTLARLRRPANRTGWLLLLAGLGLAAEDLQLSTDPGLHAFGLLTAAASTGPMAHLVLAFPLGRLRGRTDRVIVTAAYAWSLLAMPLATLLPRIDLPSGLAGLDSVGTAVGALAVPLAVATFVRLVQNWRSTRPRLRAVMTPVLLINVALGASALGAAVSWSAEWASYRPFVVAGQLGTVAVPLVFLLGVLRVQLGRTGVARLVEELNAPLAPTVLQRLVAQVLSDPGLVIAYERSDGTGLVDLDGEPVVAGPGRVVTPVRHDETTIGALVHDPAVTEDEHLLRAVAAGVGIALENQRLTAELRAQLAEVSGSRARIVAAEQRARVRIERDLHDGVQAPLVAALISIRGAAAQLDPTGGRPDLARAAAGLEQGLADLRRITHGIRPALLAEAGLAPALRALLAATDAETSLHLDVPPLAENEEETLYYVVAETSTNAVRHGRAGRIQVTVSGRGERIEAEVRDDGTGRAVVRSGGGLEGLRDRVAALDGRLEVSSRPGCGTTVRVELPRVELPRRPR